jgi:hypothetical protein
MYNCIRKHDDEDFKCKARKVLSSHGGGTDFSAPCVQNVNLKGKHKGDHRDAYGHTWPWTKYDVWIEGE